MMRLSTSHLNLLVVDTFNQENVQAQSQGDRRLTYFIFCALKPFVRLHSTRPCDLKILRPLASQLLHLACPLPPKGAKLTSSAVSVAPSCDWPFCFEGAPSRWCVLLVRTTFRVNASPMLPLLPSIFLSLSLSMKRKKSKVKLKNPSGTYTSTCKFKLGHNLFFESQFLDLEFREEKGENQTFEIPANVWSAAPLQRKEGGKQHHPQGKRRIRSSKKKRTKRESSTTPLKERENAAPLRTEGG